MCSTCCSSTKSLEYVLDCMPQLTWQCSADTGDVYYANNGWRNYTGLPSSLTSSLWHTIVHPDDVSVAIHEWEKCCKNRAASSLAYRLRHVGGDGEYKWHQVSYHFDSINNIAWWVGFGTDIPLATSLNVSVREVEEMYWRVVEAAAYPIITIDAEGVVITFNQASQDMFQYSKGDILGKPFADIIDIHGAIAEATSTTVQVAAKKRDGAYIPVSLSVGQFQQFGRQLYVLVFHEAESELKLQQELHRSKDNFLRNMSHELRTPLFGLLGTMSTMQVPQDPTLQIELKHMEDCTWRLLSVVNNMIDFYKLENLVIAPLSLPFNPRDMIADLCTSHNICVNEGVNFSYQVSDTVPQTLVSDVNFLKHTFSNLLSNSLRFTQQGSVNAILNVEQIDDSDRLMFNFTLVDTGIGIAYDFFPKMFQPFSQMDSSDSRKYGGVGLGLAVSKRLVDLLGGTITFKSSLGEGSEFLVSVPVAIPKEGESAAVLYEVSNISVPSPSSSATDSPVPSPPHTPTSSTSPTFKGTRPSLLSPISFSHPHSSGAEPCACGRNRSPSSPLSNSFRPSLPSASQLADTPTSSLIPPPPFSPSSSASNSPFCSPASSPPCSPTSSISGPTILRSLNSVSPISHILPESSSAVSLIFQPASARPSFLLEMQGKASHLCPTDRPCPLCVSARWPQVPKSPTSAPRALFPSSHSYSGAPSVRRIAAHRMARANCTKPAGQPTSPLALKSSLDSQLTALEPQVAAFLSSYNATRRPSSTPVPLPPLFACKLTTSGTLEPVVEVSTTTDTIDPTEVPLPLTPSPSPPHSPVLLKMSRAVSSPAVYSSAAGESDSPTTTTTVTTATTADTEDDHEEDAEVAKVIEASKHSPPRAPSKDESVPQPQPQPNGKPLRTSSNFPIIPKLNIPSPARTSAPLTTPPTTPPKNATPRTPTTPTTPKTPTIAPRTPTTPKTPTKHRNSLVASGPLAILANLFAQTSPTKAPSTITSPSLMSSTSSLGTSTSPSTSPSPRSSQMVSSSPDSPCSFYAPLVPASTSPPKSSNALARVTSLPSLSKSHSQIRPQSPSSPANTLSPLLSFVPVSRTTSFPSFNAFIQKPDPTTPSPPSSPSSPSSPPSPPKQRMDSLADSTIVVNDSSSRWALHSSLGTLLVPSPSSSLPSPDRSCYNIRSHQIRSSGPITIIHKDSPPASPGMSPMMSPFSPRLHSSEHLPPLFPYSFSPPYYGLHSQSSSPSPTSSPNQLRGSPLSVASSPTSTSSSPSSYSFNSGSSPVVTSPTLSSFTPSPPSPLYSSVLLSSGSPPSPTPPTSNYGVTPGLRILVVEDNLLNQNIIKKMLERVGCEVYLAIHGREALDILYSENHEKYIGYAKFHMIFMDCQMPVLDGYKATRRIRKREGGAAGQHMRIVAVTASSHAEDERKCLSSGMDGFIAKPVSAQTLYNAIIQS